MSAVLGFHTYRKHNHSSSSTGMGRASYGKRRAMSSSSTKSGWSVDLSSDYDDDTNLSGVPMASPGMACCVFVSVVLCCVGIIMVSFAYLPPGDSRPLIAIGGPVLFSIGLVSGISVGVIRVTAVRRYKKEVASEARRMSSRRNKSVEPSNLDDGEQSFDDREDDDDDEDNGEMADGHVPWAKSAHNYSLRGSLRNPQRLPPLNVRPNGPSAQNHTPPSMFNPDASTVRIHDSTNLKTIPELANMKAASPRLSIISSDRRTSYISEV